MSVTVRRRGARIEYDIRFQWPDGTMFRERRSAPVEGRQAARRWAMLRERALFAAGKEGAAAVADGATGVTTVAELPGLEWPSRAGVYFVRCAGRVKIGHSTDVRRRLQRLQTGAPAPLELLAVASGGADAEAAYHHRFAVHRANGEWFDATPELVAEVVTLNVEPKPNPAGAEHISRLEAYYRRGTGGEPGNEPPNS